MVQAVLGGFLWRPSPSTVPKSTEPPLTYAAISHATAVLLDSRARYVNISDSIENPSPTAVVSWLDEDPPEDGGDLDGVCAPASAAHNAQTHKARAAVFCRFAEPGFTKPWDRDMF